MLRIFLLSHKYSTQTGNKIMKYLNVAEKNDAAKTIANHLSNGTSRRREGLSVYNKIYEFGATVRGQNCEMIMTSVSGHLLNYAFSQNYKNWQSCDPIQLFDLPITKTCPGDFVKIKDTIEREVRKCNGLIIWTDCDREGENIGFEIIDVCRNIKPTIQVFRARFSEITTQAINRALDNLMPPDDKASIAVDVRQQLDLRIGAAFTRFQTLRLQAVFPNQIAQQLVSYGSCQIPTLGFVVQRYREAENFIPQTFWRIKVIHTVDKIPVEFIWSRKRLYDKQCCESIFTLCKSNPQALVTNVSEKPKSKWRPTPLDTVELEKLGSRKLKITAKETMTIAEKLYREGIISYPRTETNIFSKEIDLRKLVEMQSPHPEWGEFASKVLSWGPNPRNGKKTDQAHPPIHPTKFVTNLGGNEKKIYDLIVRHFLACVSRDATGSETIVSILISDEEFTATGLVIYEKNYLEVYVYDRWNSKEIHNYRNGNTFEPTEISMPDGTTTAPQMLTEADLIALMEKHGIGTDATHAEHISKIKERGYIGVVDRGFLVPGQLGMGLVEAYDAMNLTLSQPKLRADLEIDLKLICEGRKDPNEVLNSQISQYKEVYRRIIDQATELDRTMASRFNETPREPPPTIVSGIKKEIFKCPKCNQNHMGLSKKKDDAGYFIGCFGYPDCKNIIWLSDMIKDIKVTDLNCATCGPQTKKISLTFKSRRFLAILGAIEETYTSCLVCDSNLRNALNIGDDKVIRSRNNSIDQNQRQNTSTVLQTSNNWFNQSNNDRQQQNVSSNQQRNIVNRPPAPVIRNQVPNRNDNPPVNRNRPTFDQDRIPTNRSNSNNNNNNLPPPNRSWNQNPSTSNQNNGNNPNGNGWFPDSDQRPQNHRNASNDHNDDEEIRCPKCNQLAVKLTVRKESQNKGREFYTCKNTDQCNFFKWADGNPSQTTSSWGGNNVNNDSFRQPSTSSRQPSTSSNQTRNNDSRQNNQRKRKCGLCRQEGHTKLKCPRSSELDLMS